MLCADNCAQEWCALWRQTQVELVDSYGVVNQQTCLSPCTVHRFSCLSPNPRGTGWWLRHGESTELCTVHCFSCSWVDSYGVVNQLYCAPFQLFEPKPQGELVDDYDMVNQQSCVLCTVSAVCGLTVMMWWINRPVYHPVLCTVSAVWAQTPGGAGSQLRRGMRAHEEELSPCRRGRQTHCPSGAWRPRWQLPAWCCRSHGQRWVDNATVGSPWVPAPVEIRVLNKNMSLPKADEVGVLQEWVVISMFG